MFDRTNMTDEHRLAITEMIGVQTMHEAMEYFSKKGRTMEQCYQFYKENVAIWRQRDMAFVINESFEERMAMENTHTVQNITITSKVGSFSMPCIKIELPKIIPYKRVEK